MLLQSSLLQIENLKIKFYSHSLCNHHCKFTVEILTRSNDDIYYWKTDYKQGLEMNMNLSGQLIGDFNFNSNQIHGYYYKEGVTCAFEHYIR